MFPFSLFYYNNKNNNNNDNDNDNDNFALKNSILNTKVLNLEYDMLVMKEKYNELSKTNKDLNNKIKSKEMHISDLCYEIDKLQCKLNENNEIIKKNYKNSKYPHTVNPM